MISEEVDEIADRFLMDFFSTGKKEYYVVGNLIKKTRENVLEHYSNGTLEPLLERFSVDKKNIEIIRGMVGEIYRKMHKGIEIKDYMAEQVSR